MKNSQIFYFKVVAVELSLLYLYLGMACVSIVHFPPGNPVLVRII